MKKQDSKFVSLTAAKATASADDDKLRVVLGSTLYDDRDNSPLSDQLHGSNFSCRIRNGYEGKEHHFDEEEYHHMDDYDGSIKVKEEVPWLEQEEKKQQQDQEEQRQSSSYAISTHDTGRWPFPFFNEDLCYYDHMMSNGDMPSIHIGNKENDGDAALSHGATTTDLSMDSPPVYDAEKMRNVSRSKKATAGIVKIERFQQLERRKKMMIIGFFIALAVLSSTSLVIGHSRQQTHVSSLKIIDEEDLKDTSKERKEEIKKTLLDAQISVANVFENSNSPQSLALNWISNVDPQHVMPRDKKTLIQRYACAVFYFSITEWDEHSIRLLEQNEDTNETFIATRNSTWLSEKSVCEWSGISCSNDKKKDAAGVTSFHFTGGKVDGPLVREILVAFQEVSNRSTMEEL